MKHKNYILLLLVVAIGISIQTDACPHECICSETRADCSSRQLQEIPDQIPESVTSVDLHDNNISEADANKLTHLHKLEMLSLHTNHLTRLKSLTFVSLTQLKNLNIGYNNIKEIEDNVFTQLTSLQDLDLTNNQLTDITGKFNISSLRRLFLSNNQITTLQNHSLDGVRNLYKLVLDNNNISYISQSAFAGMVHLSNLVLRGNPIKNIDHIFGDLGTMLYLDVSSCFLTSIPQGLPWALGKLNISDNKLRVIQSQDLYSTRYLRLMILDNNQIQIIHNGALLYTPYLTEVQINHNKLRMLPQIPKNIETFSANNNEIQKLFQFNFVHDSALRKLILSRNQITQISANTFSHLSNLSILLLDHNSIQDLKNMSFAGLRQLINLNLEFNPISKIESRAFGGLQKLKQLHLANVQANETIIQGIIFQDIPSLSNLNLQSSPSIIYDILNSSDLLRTLRNIQHLNLMNGTLETLSEDIRIFLPNLESLQLSDNPWQCDTALVRLRNWISDSPKLFANSTIICTSPEHLRGRLIQDVSIEELKLAETFTTSNIIDTSVNTTESVTSSIISTIVNTTASVSYNEDVSDGESTEDDDHSRHDTLPLLFQISITPSLTNVQATSTFSQTVSTRKFMVSDSNPWVQLPTTSDEVQMTSSDYESVRTSVLPSHSSTSLRYYTEENLIQSTPAIISHSISKNIATASIYPTSVSFIAKSATSFSDITQTQLTTFNIDATKIHSLSSSLDTSMTIRESEMIPTFLPVTSSINNINLLNITTKMLMDISSTNLPILNRTPVNELAMTELNNYSASVKESSMDQEPSQTTLDMQTVLTSNSDSNINTDGYPVKHHAKTENRLPTFSSATNTKLRVIIITVSTSLLALAVGLFVAIIAVRYCKKRKIVSILDNSQNSTSQNGTELQTETSDTVFIISHMSGEQTDHPATDTHTDDHLTTDTHTDDAPNNASSKNNSEVKNGTKQTKKGLKSKRQSVVSRTSFDCISGHKEDESELLMYSWK
uniref:LRRCT domain-containing protein n=1 Tax=Arion vulgaris TaxID=1028688 RepID=A0A0B7AJD6_9EUPU